MNTQKIVWIGIVFLSFIMAGCGSVSNPDAAVNRLSNTSELSSNQVEEIASVLSMYPNNTELAIAFIKDTSAVYYGAFRDNDILKTVNDRHAVFEIGSLTKVFTSALLARLQTEGKLQIDQPIQSYLDFPLHDSLNVTFKQLANHTSGLPRVPGGFIWESLLNLDNPYKNYDEEKLRTYMRENMELNAPPGTTYQYSNIGAGMLGYVLTRVEGKSYEELTQQNIFDPLKMESTTTNRKEVSDRLVPGLTKRGGRATNWDLAALQGAGALLSTANDLSLFVMANFDPENEALNLQRAQTFSINDKMGIALGWHILKRDSGEQWYWHNGGTGGYRSSMVLNVEDKTGMVVLSNISSGHKYAAKIDTLSYRLLDSFEAEATAYIH